MNIVFMGSPEFAIPALEQLYASKHNILAVVSNVDKRRGRGGDKSPTPVKKKALELGLKVIEVESLKDDGLEAKLQNLKPDLFVVVAFRILPKNILEIPKIGSINLHASLLPKYRGAAPIHWAIIKGEKETGCTVFFLDERVDTGNILSQEKIDIKIDQTTGDVYTKLMSLGAKQLKNAVDLIDKGGYQLEKQDDKMASPAPKLNKENTKLNFHDTRVNVYNKIRGLNPFPIAWTVFNGEKVKIFGASLSEADIEVKKPGTLTNYENKLFVACLDGNLEITELQLPGKSRISGTDFVSGYNLNNGKFE